jgi:two-component system chemotaxis response regulator CheY
LILKVHMGRAPRMKVLVVDDSAMIRTLINCALSSTDGLNVEVIEAGDGLQGLAAIQQHGSSIDLILSDMNMPNMNGLSFLRSLRGSSELGQIPFVVVTADALSVSVEQARHEGAADVVRKPFRFKAIVDLVRRYTMSLRSPSASRPPRGSQPQGEATHNDNPRRRLSPRKRSAAAMDRFHTAQDVSICPPLYGRG